MYDETNQIHVTLFIQTEQLKKKTEIKIKLCILLHTIKMNHIDIIAICI